MTREKAQTAQGAVSCLVILRIILKLFHLKHNLDRRLPVQYDEQSLRLNERHVLFQRAFRLQAHNLLARDALGEFSLRVLNYPKGETRKVAIINCG